MIWPNIYKLLYSALSAMWTDTCSVSIRSEAMDISSPITKFVETILFDNLPCRLSFKLPFGKQNLTHQRNLAAETSQTVRLFLAPDILIPPGSKITVQHNGRLSSFAQSGKAAIFPSHQEISLVLFDKWT